MDWADSCKTRQTFFVLGAAYTRDLKVNQRNQINNRGNLNIRGHCSSERDYLNGLSKIYQMENCIFMFKVNFKQGIKGF